MTLMTNQTVDLIKRTTWGTPVEHVDTLHYTSCCEREITKGHYINCPNHRMNRAKQCR